MNRQRRECSPPPLAAGLKRSAPVAMPKYLEAPRPIVTETERRALVGVRRAPEMPLPLSWQAIRFVGATLLAAIIVGLAVT